MINIIKENFIKILVYIFLLFSSEGLYAGKEASGFSLIKFLTDKYPKSDFLSLYKNIWNKEFDLSVGGSLNIGNTNTLSATYSSYFNINDSTRWEFEFKVEGAYSESNHKKTKNKHLFYFNPDVMLILNKLTLFYLASIQTAEFQGVYIGTSHQLGLRLIFKSNWWFALYFSISPILFEYEENWSRELNKSILRFSIRPRLVFRFSTIKTDYL